MRCWERSAAGKFLPSVCVHEPPARSTVGAGAPLLLGTAWGLDGFYVGQLRCFWLCSTLCMRCLSGTVLFGRQANQA